MSYFLVQDFSSGLDVRKSPWTAASGSLQTLDDGQITRGGEIEKRKAFVSQGDLQNAITHALCSGKIGAGIVPTLIVFGSQTAPAGLPASVTYQRLQHPDGTVEMTDVVDWTLYNGLAYVVADYADGSQWHFYDGALVTDWGGGVVRPSMTTNALVAEHLKSLVDASPSYSASRTGDVVFITGPAGTDYAIATETLDGGGTDDQALAVNELIAAVVGIANTKSVGEFAILLGVNGAGNYIDQVRIDDNGVFTDLLSASVSYATTPELTALAVVNAINAGNPTHGYVASTKYGKVFIGASLASGATANGRVVEVIAKGAVIISNGSFAITGGTAGAGNEISSVSYNGTAITSAAVLWTTSNSTTASLVASNINAFASSPKMNAVALGDSVFVSPEKVRSSDASSITLQVVAIGTVVIGDGAQAPIEADHPNDYTSPARPGFPETQVP